MSKKGCDWARTVYVAYSLGVQPLQLRSRSPATRSPARLRRPGRSPAQNETAIPEVSPTLLMRNGALSLAGRGVVLHEALHRRHGEAARGRGKAPVANGFVTRPEILADQGLWQLGVS